MSILVSKTLTQLAYPLSLSLFLSLLAGLLFWRGQKRPAGLCLLFSLLVLWVLSLPAVSGSLRASLERRYPPFIWLDWEGGGTEQGRFPDKRLPEHALTCSTK